MRNMWLLENRKKHLIDFMERQLLSGSFPDARYLSEMVTVYLLHVVNHHFHGIDDGFNVNWEFKDVDGRVEVIHGSIRLARKTAA